MFLENPFYRPNPFRGLHSSINYQQTQTTHTKHYWDTSNCSKGSHDRLESLLKINPFSVPFEHQIIKNNGIQDYIVDSQTRIKFRKPIERQLPSLSFNCFTKIGGGMMNPYQIQALSKSQTVQNINKKQISKIVEQEEKSQSGFNNKKQRDHQKNQKQIRSFVKNSKQFPSLLQNQLDQRISRASNYESKLNQNSRKLYVKNYQNQKSKNENQVFQDLSFNDFPPAINEQDKQLSNFNLLMNQNQNIDYNTKNSNHSEQIPDIAKISHIVKNDSKQLIVQENEIYPYESMNNILSVSQSKKKPSEIDVEGQHYFRIALRNSQQL